MEWFSSFILILTGSYVIRKWIHSQNKLPLISTPLYSTYASNVSTTLSSLYVFWSICIKSPLRRIIPTVGAYTLNYKCTHIISNWFFIFETKNRTLTGLLPLEDTNKYSAWVKNNRNIAVVIFIIDTFLGTSLTELKFENQTLSSLHFDFLRQLTFFLLVETLAYFSISPRKTTH